MRWLPEISYINHYSSRAMHEAVSCAGFRDVLAILAVLSMTACSAPERSRSLADSRTSAITIAQQVCSTCHGVTGKSTSPNFPNLAAQMEPYVIAQLAGYKHHGRTDPDGFEYMWGISGHLTETQITGLAHYYSSQSAPEGIAGNPEKIKAGAHIFAEGISTKNVAACASCHGAAGQGMANFPRLAGQHAAYLIKQLVVFQRTEGRPDGAVMKAITHNMSEANMSEVAEYLQSLGEHPQ